MIDGRVIAAGIAAATHARKSNLEYEALYDGDEASEEVPLAPIPVEGTPEESPGPPPDEPQPRPERHRPRKG